jgi:UDP-2,4-diacetamido-2,4,6-trideoxy-beta-L-altropyranose hydrolase
MLKLKLREATADDIHWLFKLRNDPIAYKNFLNPRPIEWEKHVDWFKKALIGNKCFIYVVYNEKKENISMIKFIVRGQKAEVGINLDKNFRGLGYGVEIIRIGTRHFLKNFSKVTKIIALIRKNNLGSIKVFSKAGYVLTQKKDGILSYEYQEPGEKNII